MKLRNKKTGETIDVVVNPTDFNTIHLCRVNTVKSMQAVNTWEYNSLADLNEEWEDAPEEPKGYWCVDWDGDINHIDLLGNPEGEPEEKKKQIGNYFETEEEAEKAVEKLKAWKRLRDKGFRFIDHIDRDSGQGMTRYEWNGYINGEDLDLLFGGKE